MWTPMTPGGQAPTPSGGRCRAAPDRAGMATARQARPASPPTAVTRTAAGKARSAQNARRHGLTLSAAVNPACSDAVAALAHAIAGTPADPVRHALAWRIAAAQVDVARARRARGDLYPAALASRDGVRRLAAIDDYERRALARRRSAIRAFDAHAQRQWRENEPKARPQAAPARENEPTHGAPPPRPRENEPNPTSTQHAARSRRRNPVYPSRPGRRVASARFAFQREKKELAIGPRRWPRARMRSRHRPWLRSGRLRRRSRARYRTDEPQ